MRKSSFSEEQIIAILKEQAAGMKTAEVCRRHGISQRKRRLTATWFSSCTLPVSGTSAWQVL